MGTLTFSSQGFEGGANIKKVGDNLYRTRVGTFNQFNSIGDYYPMTGELSRIFNKDLRETIVDGKLYSELDHPPFKKGMTAEEYIRRILFIEPSNLIAHISKLEIEETKRKNSNGVEYDVYMTFSPFGSHKQILEDSIANKVINTAFSLRCLFRRSIVGGVTYRNITTVITYDFVLKNGVVKADKFSAGLESEDIDFKVKEIKEAIVNIKEEIKMNEMVGKESNYNSSLLESIETACNSGDCLLEY